MEESIPRKHDKANQQTEETNRSADDAAEGTKREGRAGQEW